MFHIENAHLQFVSGTVTANDLLPVFTLEASALLADVKLFGLAFFLFILFLCTSPTRQQTAHKQSNHETVSLDGTWQETQQQLHIFYGPQLA